MASISINDDDRDDERYLPQRSIAPSSTGYRNDRNGNPTSTPRTPSFLPNDPSNWPPQPNPDDYRGPWGSPRGTTVPSPAPSSTPDFSAFLNDLAARTGSTVEASDLAELQRKQANAGRDNNAGDVAAHMRALEQQYAQRGASTSHRQHDSQSAAGNALYGSGTGNASNTPGGAFNGLPFDAARSATTGGANMPPFQFDDPYTKLYEQTAQNYLQRLQGNSELDRLMGLLSQQITDLSTPGYSPEEMALLNTQTLEPIEQLRGATRRRANERASARGFLPTSGIADLVPANDAVGSEPLDVAYDRMRTVANRDLSINALNQRNADQVRAIQLAQLGVDVPNQMGRESLNVANSLYQLPRNALMDSLQVLNASSPQGGINSLIQLMQLQQQQSQFNAGNNAALWGNIGQILAGLL